MDEQELLQRLQPDIEKIDQAMRADFAALASPLLREILEYAVFSGGKRIRPLLTVLSARLCGLPKTAVEGHRLAMVFEYLHAASLLHDDVVDRAERRRGRPTANLVWGNPATVLAGDFLHARAMQLAGNVGGVACLTIISGATHAMVEAEFFQMAHAREQQYDEDSYFQVLLGKTSALIGAACEVGALYAEADPLARKALRSYGKYLGLAFQVVDDLLDYWGDDGTTGKAVGHDFIEGKVTLPLIHALAKGSEEEHLLIMGLLQGDEEGRRQAIPTVKLFIERNGGLDFARFKARALVDSAVVALEQFPECETRSFLQSLACYVLTRER